MFSSNPIERTNPSPNPNPNPMTIRFKFRSSVAFDSVDLRGRRSISVRDLRAKIVAQKKLQICQDFALVISDPETGKEFEDDEFEIKEGSSVVIKRVPSGLSTPCNLRDTGIVAKKDGGYEDKALLPPAEKVDMENFDDFGVDLFPTLQDDVVQRCFETSISRCQNIKISDLSEAMPKEVVGDNCSKEPDNVEIKCGSKIEAHEKLDEYCSMPSPTLKMDLPTELRCSLCNAIFKEAVMIPCCQHSFCDKCVRLALIEKARCPRCSSMKCTIKDLLPNLSLRQAIKHFLEAQVANNAPYNNICQIAPDVESGIHVKEVSCAISIQRKELPFPHSSSTTGKGLNQVIANSPHGSKQNGGSGSCLIRLEADKFGKSTLLPHKMKELRAENTSAEALKHMTGFQGNNVFSKLPQDLLQEEANTTVQKKGLGVIVSDGNGILMQPSRHRKADRYCYMCGSPNHLIRDCPEASNPYPVNQTEYAVFAGSMPSYEQAYCRGASFPNARPYANVYGAPGMMPFDQAMVAISPFGISPYMTSMCPGMPVSYGFMRMGGVQPHMMTGAERPYSHAAFADLRYGERMHKSLDEHLESRFREHDHENMCEDYRNKGTQRVSHEKRHQLHEETTGGFLDDDQHHIHKKHQSDKYCGYSHDKHYAFSHHQPSVQSDEELHHVDQRHENGSHQSVSGRDQRTRCSERSNSEVQDLSDSSNRHSRERKKHHHEGCTKKQSEGRGRYSSDLSRKSHHRSRKEMSDDEAVKDHRKHSRRHHRRSELDVESSSSSGRWQHFKEKESRQCSRPAKQVPKSNDNRLDYDRWQMGDGLDDDYVGRHYHKRKKTQ